MLRAFIFVLMGVVLLGGTGWAEEARDKLYLSADALTHDNKNKIFRARGQVEMAYGGYVLTADEANFDAKDDIVEVQGNIRLLTPEGMVFYGERALLDEKLQDGFIKDMRMILQEGRFAAQEGERLFGTEHRLSYAVYSSCRPCEDGGVLPWQIKARTIIHDAESRDIIYHHALLELYGIPVLYVPYYITPDPTVKRRSGLLRPLLDYNSLLGSITAAPLYIAYNPYGDMTLTPGYASREGAFVFGNIRHNFEEGQFVLDASFAHDDAGDYSKENYLWHVDSEARFEVDDFYWGWDGGYRSDRTYLKRYDFLTTHPYEQIIRSSFFMGYGGRYVNVNLENIYFQDLRPHRLMKSPSILPRLRVRMRAPSNDDTQRLFMNVDGINLRQAGGRTMQRFIFDAAWETMGIWAGQHINAQFGMRSDVYRYHDFIPNNRQNSQLDYGKVRFVPRFLLDWRAPFYTDGVLGRFILEPRMMVSVTTNKSYRDSILNLDGEAFFFDKTLLFAPDRLTGFDRIETGARIDYGVQSYILDSVGYGLLVQVGQSYRTHKDEHLPPSLRKNFSQWVGGVRWQWDKDLAIRYQFALGGDANSSNSLHAISMRGKIGSYQLQGRYGTFKDEQGRAHEIGGGLQIPLSDSWLVEGTGRYNLARSDSIHYGLALRYRRDCIDVSLAYGRTFTQDGDARRHDSISFKINLIGLGGDSF